jgi:hypothetical protein
LGNRIRPGWGEILAGVLRKKIKQKTKAAKNQTNKIS